jgi:hypothetical protein
MKRKAGLLGPRLSLDSSSEFILWISYFVDSFKSENFEFELADARDQIMTAILGGNIELFGLVRHQNQVCSGYRYLVVLHEQERKKCKNFDF